METNLFKRIYINGDPERLPKDTGVYLVFVKDDQQVQQWTFNKGSDTDDSIDWLENIAWYEVPVSREDMIEVLDRYFTATSVKLVLIADEIIGGK